MSFGASPYGPPTAPQQPENDIVVEMPDGQLVAFKPGTTPQRIAELISSKYPNEIQAMLKKKGVADDALAVMLKGLYNLPGALAGQKEAISLSVVENIGQIAAPTSLYPDGKKPKPAGTVMEQLEAEIYEMKNGNAAAVPTADADAPVGSRAWLDGKSVPSYDMPGMLEGMPDVKQAVGRWAAEQSLRRQDKLKNIKEDAEKVTVVPGSLDDILGNAVPNLANMVIPVGASILTRRAETGLAIMGAQTYGDAYARGREKGLRPQEATQYGVMTALSEAIPEKLPLSAILAGKGGLLRQFATAVGLEGGTEGLTALLNMAIDKKFLGAEDTWSEASNKLITAIASGAILGGGMSVTAQGIKKFLGEDITDVPPDDKAAPTTEKIVETDFGAPAGVDPGIAETLGNVAAQPLAIEREKRLALPPPSAIEDIVSPIAERQQTIKVMPTEEQLAQKASDRTRAVIGAARETATPIGTFSMNEVGNDVAGKVRLRRMRTGHTAPDAPVSVADMQAAGVDQSFIDALIIGRKPLTGGQLTAANRPSLESRAVPAGPFTEEQYSASVAATRNAGRFSIDGVRKAAVSSPRVAKLIRDEMVARGDLVPGTRPGTFKPYERPAAPATQSPLKTFTVAPVASDTIAVKKDGKVIGVFEDQVAAKNAVRGIREREKAEQNPPSRVEVVRGGVDAEGKAMTERPGFAVYENRYDDEGKLVDRAIVSTHVAEDTARAQAENLTARPAPQPSQPGVAAPTGPRPSVIARSRPQKIPTPKVLEGRVQEVVDKLNEQANKRALPLIGNRVLLTGTITDNEGNADIEGSYLKQLITLAVDRLDPNMSTDDVVEALAGVMDHETIHALREAGVLAPGTKAWSILSNYVVQAKHPDTGVTYIETAIDRNPDLADRPDVTINGQKLSIVEEAIAEAFRAWAANRRAVAGVPRTALEKIVEWFKRLVSSVPDDVFRSIETGTLARSRIKAPLSYRGAAVEKMEKARADLETATTPEQTLAAEREFLQAREQAAEDRVGRVGPRSVLGTTPSDEFMAGPRASFDRVEALLENAKTTLNKAPSPNRGTPDNTFLMKLADAYDKAPHEPSNTAVSKAYASLVAETKSFFNALNVTVVPWRENGQPYASQRDLIDDAADGQIKMRLSNDLFPPHPSRRNHPMQEPSGFTTEDGSSLSNGDLLRVVAEAYGYAPVGAVPSQLGDYRAYSTIKDMYSPQGQRALATEMLAQSAWQNTGPKMRLTDGSIASPDALGFVPPNMREFAEQKATLLPADVLVEPVQPREDILDMSGIGDETRYSRSARNPQVDPTNPDIRYSRGMSYGPAEKRARDGERGYALGNLAPLAGAPQVEGASGPDPRLVAVAEQYASDNGITLRRQAEYVEVDPVRAKRIADAYEAMPHTPNDPAVNAAYKALIDQTVAQYRALEKAGYKFWFIDPNTAEGAAYASSPWNAMRDLRANQSMGSFPTVAGFGTKEDFNPAANPLLTDTGIRWPFGSPTGPAQPVLANDLFRAVHDAFGHGIEGAGFRAQGEENAWQAHSRLFYGDAVGAITTETRGQNSWLNYGPFGEQNRKASAEDTVFADQKTGLMPEWTWLEGRAGDMGELTADKSYNVGSPEFYAMLDDVVPGGKYYGNPKRSAAAVTSPADTSSPAFSQTRDGNAFFGGDVAYQQLQMARDGDRGAVLIYLHPEDFLRLANTAPVREQDLYTAAANDGLKFNTLPSLVVESGKVGAVPVLNSDGVGMARALLGKAKSIPVVLYPSGKGQIENVDTLTANGNVVDMLGMYEFDISRRGPRQGLSTIAFKSWFKQSAAVDETGAPKRVYHTTTPDRNFGVFDTQSSEFRSHFGTVERASEISGGRGTGYPTYLSIQNPLRLEDDGSFKTDAVAKQMLDLGVIDAALYDDVVNNTVNGSVALQDAAADAGYDGVVYRTAPDAPESYIIFQPTQAKAAVANRGTWSAADPDIRYSRGTSRRRAPTPGDDIYTAAQMKTDGLLGSKVEKIFRSKKGKAVSVFNGRVNFQDKSLSFKEFTDRLNRSGVAIPASINAAMVEEKLQSKAGYQDRRRAETMRDSLLAKIEEASKANKFSYKDVDDLLLARHAVERNQFLRAKGSPKHSGISDTDAKDIIDRLRAKGVLREITDLADTYVVPIVKDINNIRIASGQVTPDVVAADPFNYWVPMRDTDDYDPFDVIAKGPKVTGSGAFTSSGRRPDPRMYGRDSKPGDVIANLFTLQSVALMRAERAEVMKAFHKTMQLPGASAVVGDTLKRVLSPPKKLAYGADGMIREIVDQDFRNRPGIIVFKIDGKEVVYKTDDFYLERALKGPLLEPLNSIFDRLVTVAAGYVKLITTRNPAFIIYQVSRDLLEALIHSGQYKVPGLARGIVTRLPRAMKAIAAYKLNEKRYKDLFEKSEREKAGATSLLSAAERAEIARISPLVQYYWEADKNGWLVSFLNYQDMSQRIDRIHRDVGLLTGARGKLAEIQKAMDSFFHVWDGVNDVFENAARLSFYSTVRDFQKKNQKADGRADSLDAIDEAGMAMKNLTINFNKGGRYKKAMNANFLFSSVIANGAAATGKMLKSKRGQAVIGSVIAFSFVLDILNRALSDDENEDGIKDYDAMPESDLNRNLYIPVDKLGIPGINEPLQIPLALGPIGAFFSLGRNLSRAINGFMNPRQPVSPLGSVGRVIVSSADAINIVGDTTRPINFFAPWYLDPIVDLTLNKRWTGGDIAPPAYDSTKPNFQRYYSTTNPFYLSLAEGLSDLTGGNEERGGWFDYSPENYKYIVDFLGAGTGKFLGDVYYSGTEAIPLALSGDTELIKGSSIPFVGKFVGTEAETRGARDEYFRLREEVKTTKKEIGSDDRDIRKEGRARIAGGSVVQSAFARADNQLEDLRKKLRAAQENRTMEYTSRLRKIEEIRAKMDAIMAKAVKSYYDRSEKLN